nr:tyrosine-type recombinase/integrase [Clostridium bowmanii]
MCLKWRAPHFRHTHATMLLEAGANIKDIQTRLGHSKLSTTMDTYSHVTTKIKNDSVNIFENIIATIK